MMLTWFKFPSVAASHFISTLPHSSSASSSRMPSFQKSTHRFLRAICLFILCISLLQSLFHSNQATASPIPTKASSGSETASIAPADGHPLENTFRSQVVNDGSSKVYIDTLTPEEVAEHRKTGRLPQRTMQLIEQVLKAQEQLEHSDTPDSPVGAADLFEELFAETHT